MVFIGSAEPEIIKNAIRVPETYPEDDQKAPFNPKEVVRIREDAKFDDLYEIYGESLGEGKFGKVFQCREKKTGLELAAKFVKIKKDADRTTVEREVSIMTKMNHPRIAQIYDAFYAGTNDVILVMEIVRGGELFNRVAEDSYILTEKAVAMIVCQICESIDYIHSQNIIHLDIKPENIMCVSETGNRIKLIDFGLAQFYDGSKDLYYMAGTPEFAAPEVIKYEPLDYRTDMWSVGVITYILLSGYSPFLGDNVAETYVNVEKGEWEFTEEFEMVTEDAKSFISNLLSYDKNERMYPRDCLAHPWIAKTRALASIETLLSEPVIDDGPQINTDKLKRYVVRRRFRKLAFAVMCYVDFRNILLDLRKRKSEKGEAFFSSAHIPEEPSMGGILGKLRAAKAAECEENGALPVKEEVMSGGDAKRASIGESPSDAETTKIAKKKKKQPTTMSSGTDRPREKKAKKADSDEMPSRLTVEVDMPLSEREDVKEKKKRMKKEVTAMATSSQEKPAKMVKKNSEVTSDGERRVRNAKSPSPAKNVPVIHEELVKDETKDETKPRKKITKPASSDSGVVIEKQKRTKSRDTNQSSDVSSVLDLPDATVKKSTKKSLSTTSSKFSECSDDYSEAVDKPKTPKKTASSIAKRMSKFSENGEGGSVPLMMPTICVQPPTPATAPSSSRDKKGTSPLSVKIPSPSVSPSPASPTSTEDSHPGLRKKSIGDGPKKRKLWKQEKHCADEGPSESRRSTEVIAVLKNALPPAAEAEKAALVKNRALNSPLAERIARMENMAKEKEKERQERRGRIKVGDRDSSSMSLSMSSKSPSPARSKVVAMTAEKVETTTKTTTTSVKQKKEEKESGVVVKTANGTIEQREKKEFESDSVKTETKVRESPDEEKKKTTKKTVVKQQTTVTAQQKVRNEETGKSDKPQEKISTVSASKELKHELTLKDSSKVNGSFDKDSELKMTKSSKKKIMSRDISTESGAEEKPKKKSEILLAETETVGIVAKEKDKTERVKKTSIAVARMGTSNESSHADSPSSTDSTPMKKKTKKVKSISKEPTPPLIEYPASIADDIQLFKEARAKAKKKEEEHRHVRFADESLASEAEEPVDHVKVQKMTKLERTTSEDLKKGDDPGGKSRRKTSYFEVTEDEEETLSAVKEDFSFANLRQRLEQQLTKKHTSEEEDEPQPAPKKEIICPSTNSLLKKWKSFEKTNL